MKHDFRHKTQPLPLFPYVRNPILVCRICGITGLIETNKMYNHKEYSYCGKCLREILSQEKHEIT